MCRWDKFGIKDTKRPKNPIATSKQPGANTGCWEQNQGIAHAPGEKAMAPHSSTLAWEIPWAEEPCRLQSMGSLRVTTE